MTATPTEKNLGGYIDYYSQLKFLGYIDYNIQYFRNLFCILNYVQYPGMPFPVREIIGYRKLELDKYLMPIIKNTCRYYVAKYGDYEPQYIDIKIPKAKNYNKLLINRTYENITFDNVSAFRVGKKSITTPHIDFPSYSIAPEVEQLSTKLLAFLIGSISGKNLLIINFSNSLAIGLILKVNLYVAHSSNK